MKRKAAYAHFWGWMGAGGGALALFLFFFRGVPYHLFHREQTTLFLYSVEALRQYLSQPGALARLAGDFLTQFFYYEGLGPLIMALLLTLWGTVAYRLLSPYIGRWAWIPAIVAVVWEAGRACGLDYPLAGTVTWIGIGSVLLLCRWMIRRWSWRWGIPLGVVILLAGYGCFGYGEWAKAWDKPDFAREYRLAIDAEMYFGRTDKARCLLDQARVRSPYVTYYYNLLNAQQRLLPDALTDYYQPAAYGLFLPVAPGSDYLTISAANEVWYVLGDMTMAEHAAILGMIFSPHHTGARAIKRLAEINLINGDEAAALKYLRLLRMTLCYRDWAERRMPGRQTPEVQRWLEQKRALIPTTDTLRSSANVPLSLRHLLRSHPENVMARDYLLCFDLLNKDIPAFAQDYQEFLAGNSAPPYRLYAEALLVFLAGKTASLDEVKRWNIPPSLMADFHEYTRLYEAGGGKAAPLRSKFEKTYWFYFHFAQPMNK